MDGEATVTDIQTSPATRLRLAEMGVRVGARVQVLNRTTGGGRIVAVDGTRVVVDHDLARAILAVIDD